MMKKKVLLLLGAALLAGCEKEAGPGPEIHDSKYVGIGTDGRQIDPSEGAGACALDQFTGLTWEVKAESGMRDFRHTYSWYDPEEAHPQPSNSEELDYRGLANGGECTGSDCDTTAFVLAVNEAGLCGFKDWRLPTRDELGSISDPRKAESSPTINMRYFPHSLAVEYWSSNDYHFQWDAAWVWNFEFGHDRVEWKATPRSIRLVRGQAAYLTRVKD